MAREEQRHRHCCLRKSTVWVIPVEAYETLKTLFKEGKLLELVLVRISNIACANVVEEFFLILLKSQTSAEVKEENNMVYEVFIGNVNMNKQETIVI